MLIYGWGSFNRRDHSVVRGKCPSCFREGYQKSFTCSRFFTLYFVPVIPLGKQKILSECPACKVAYGLPYRKWIQQQKTELPKLIGEYQANPSNAEAARNALDAAVGLRSRTALLQVGPHIRAAFRGNAPVLADLASAYSTLCLDREADEVYLDVIKLTADEEITARAEAHMESQKQPQPKPANRVLQSLPVLIVPAALLFALVLFLKSAVTAQTDRAYLLNGLDQPYSVMVNGERMELAPRQRLRTERLVFGKNEIAPTPEHPFVQAHTFEFNVPWYRRPSDDSVLVVNPDQTAVVVWERTGYAKTPPENAYQFEPRTGQAHYIYESIDFPFGSFPNSIQVSADGSVTYRTRVSELTNQTLRQTAQLFLSQKKSADLQDYLRAKLRSPDQPTMAIHLAASLLPNDEFLALAKPKLAMRPAQIEWHRAYQELKKNSDSTGLEKEYRQLAAEHPSDSALAYLFGRVVKDSDETRAAFERAAAMENPTGYAAHGLSYHCLLDGDFSRALAYAETALRLDPNNEAFLATRRNAWWGKGDWAALEKEAGDPLSSKNPDYAVCYEHVYRLGKLGQEAAAKAEIPKLLALLHRGSTITKSQRETGEAYFESALAIGAGDRKRFASLASRIEGKSWAFQKAVIDDELDTAIKIAASAPDDIGHLDRLTLYVLLMRKSRPEEASTQLREVIAKLSTVDLEQKQWATWLSGGPSPDVRIAAHECFDLENHFLYLTALAQKHRDRSAEYLARAAAIKHRETFHSLALAPVLETVRRTGQL